MSRQSICTRRQFLARLSALGMGAVWLAACGEQPTPDLLRVASGTPAAPSATPFPPTARPTLTATPGATSAAAPTVAATSPTPAGFADLAAVRGASPAEITRRAVAAIGGMERFVSSGANVLIKPNICNAYHGPEYASTTNPEVVGALVAMALEAGAKRVRVMDFPFGGPAEKAYAISGIGEAVQAAGGEMALLSDLALRETDIPAGRKITRWPIYGDALDADVLINVPIAKDHGTTRLTLAMKNLMGLIDNRNGFHSRGLDQCIADLNSRLRTHLTVVDGVRILLRNGPTGGSLDDVQQANTVIASADIVAADAYATTLFGMTAADIGYIMRGAEMGLGQADLGALKLAELSL